MIIERFTVGFIFRQVLGGLILTIFPPLVYERSIEDVENAHIEEYENIYGLTCEHDGRFLSPAKYSFYIPIDIEDPKYRFGWQKQMLSREKYPGYKEIFFSIPHEECHPDLDSIANGEYFQAVYHIFGSLPASWYLLSVRIGDVQIRDFQDAKWDRYIRFWMAIALLFLLVGGLIWISIRV